LLIPVLTDFGAQLQNKVYSITITINLLFLKVGLQNSPLTVFLAKINGKEQMMEQVILIKK